VNLNVNYEKEFSQLTIWSIFFTTSIDLGGEKEKKKKKVDFRVKINILEKQWRS
jgi:hypothetical protein